MENQLDTDQPTMVTLAVHTSIATTGTTKGFMNRLGNMFNGGKLRDIFNRIGCELAIDGHGLNDKHKCHMVNFSCRWWILFLLYLFNLKLGVCLLFSSCAHYLVSHVCHVSECRLLAPSVGLHLVAGFEEGLGGCLPAPSLLLQGE